MARRERGQGVARRGVERAGQGVARRGAERAGAGCGEVRGGESGGRVWCGEARRRESGDGRGRSFDTSDAMHALEARFEAVFTLVSVEVIDSRIFMST